MGATSQDAVVRGGGYLGVGNVLQGGVTGDVSVRLILVGHVGIDGEDRGGY